MSPNTTNNQSKPRGRRKNPTIVPVLLASAALFASMAGFLGVQVAQGNDPMLGAGTATAQLANGSASGNSARSQSSGSNPSPVQTSTSGAASSTASTTSTNSATRASAPGAAQSTVSNDG